MKIRCSALPKIMTSPVGKSNLDLYNDAVEKINVLKEKCENAKNKETATFKKDFEKLHELRENLHILEAKKDKITLSETAKNYINKLGS